ncbi:uncharacterized protein [Apostichopus japonicus]|uniref:uncharacterized protein isoform X2 n=1 Tax=Stichopus japonicus TaxID=307972 RepID=UPI003AB5BE05
MMFHLKFILSLYVCVSCTLFTVSSGNPPVSRCDEWNNDVMDCCNGDFENFVEDASISVNYTVVKQEKDQRIPWRLDAHVTWDHPIGNETFVYAVNMNYTITPFQALQGPTVQPFQGTCRENLYKYFPPTSCFIPEDENWAIVNGTSLTVSNLTFGFQYRFQIRIFGNGSVLSAYLTCNSEEMFHTPDCYASTNDEDFCRNKATVLSSAPVNLTVPSGERETKDDGEEIWTLLLEWKMPLSVNGYIPSYLILVTNRKDPPTPKILNSSLSVDGLFQYNVSSVVRQEDEFEIQVTPFVAVSASVGAIAGPSSIIRINPDNLIETIRKEITTPPSLAKTTNKQGIVFFTGDPPETKSIWDDFMLWFILGGSVFFILIILAIITVSVTVDRLCKGVVNKPPVERFFPHVQVHSVDEVTERKYRVEDEFKDKEIVDYKHIEQGEILGKGAFGIVKKGRALLPGATIWTDVAIKTPKTTGSSSSSQAGIIEDFKNEIRLMIELGKHQHIISVLGCCTVEEPYILITEYMMYGDLQKFLQKCYDQTNGDRDPIYKLETLHQLQIALQIADGMNYVSSTRFFHGDLAARNILVGENLLVKITDFGLTDDLYQKGYTRLSDQRRPIKWYGPESITDKYCTLKTDIWSFGVVLWEIFTFGKQTPYKGMSVNELVHRLVKTDYRLPKPPSCPPIVYTVMLACWALEPSKRPGFEDLYDTLHYIINEIGDHTNYILTDSEDDATKPSLRHSSSLLSLISSQSESTYSTYSSRLSSSTDSDITSDEQFSDCSFKTNSDFAGTFDLTVMEPILEDPEIS